MGAFLRLAGRLHRDRRGTAAIEFAFVAVILMSLLFAIVGFGFQFATRVALSYAVAEGGRAAVAGLSSADRQSLADAAVSHVLTSFSPLIDPAKAVVALTSGGQTANGEAIQVAVTYSDNRFDIFPFIPSLSGAAVVQTTFFVADPSG